MEENQVHIPDGWESYVGNEILKVQGGYAFKSNDYRDEGILLVRIGNVGNGNFVFKDVIYVPKRFQLTHSNFQLWKGDVLMGLTGDLGKICILKEGDFPYFLNQRVGKFVATDKIDNEYLFYLVSSSFIQSKFDAFFAGGAQKNISPKQIESINYLIPKFKTEQTQIATILSKVDEAITQTEKIIAKYTRIKTGLMQDLLTKGIDENGNIRNEETHEFKDSPLGRIPKEWEVVKLKNIGKVSRGKFTPRPRNNPMYYGGKYPFIQTGDISNCTSLYLDNFTQTLNEKGILVSKKFPKGTIVMTIAANIGDTAILNREMYLTDSVVGIQSSLNEVYLELFFSSIKTQLENTATQSAQKNINIEKLNEVLIKYPLSIDEQVKIVEKYLSVGNLINEFQTQLTKLQSLKTGLMQDLLSGYVRVNHLIKETANV